MSNKHKTPALRDVDYWLAQWLGSGKRQSEHTAKGYRTDLRQFFEHVGKPFNRVKVIDLLNYQSHLANQYDAAKTRARKMAAVCSFFAFLNNQEAIPPLNLNRVDRPRTPHQIDHGKLLTEKEVIALIKAVQADPVHHALLRMLYLTGTRISEVVNLRWRDLTPLEDGGEAHIKGKGRKFRQAFIPPELWADLQALRGEAGDNDHPFPFSTHWAWQVVRKAGESAGIKGAHPHQLRHAFVSHLLASGEEIVRVSQAVGHSSIATTSLYAHAQGRKDLTRKLKVK